MRLCGVASLSVLALMLAACGGGGAGTPVASTPPPPSNPNYTYNSFGALTGEQTIPLSGATMVRAEGSNVPSGSISLQPAESGVLSITFNPASGTYTVRNATLSQTFGPADASSAYSNAAFAAYEKTNGNVSDYLAIYRPSGGTGSDKPLRYTTIVNFTRLTETVSGNGFVDKQRQAFLGVGGFATQPGDMPSTGTATFTGPARAYYTFGADSILSSGFMQLVADFGAKTVQTSLNLGGPVVNQSQTNLAFTGTGTLQANGTLGGSLSGSGYNGSFTGLFTGPGAAEVGFGFRLADPNGAQIGGAAAGVR